MPDEHIRINLELRPRVVIAVPCTGSVHREADRTIRELLKQTRTADTVMWWYQEAPHDRCRNALIARFMNDADWTHLLFIDTDVTTEPDAVDRLLAHNAPIVCAPVPTMNLRYGPPDQPKSATVGTNIMLHDDPKLRGTVVPPDAVHTGYRRVDPDDFPDVPFTCDATGLGLCLIRRDVFEKIQKPWCAFVGHFDGEMIGEDIYFFRKARAAGFEILVDPSINADHYKSVDLTHLDLLYSDKIPVSSWPRLATPNDDRNILVTVFTPPTGWLHVRLVQALASWENAYGERIRIETVTADTLRGGMLELAERVASLEDRFTHVLMMRDDVVPHERTLGLLASVDAPVVGGLTRKLIDGRIRWAYWHDDPITGQLEAPQNIQLPSMNEPFSVTSLEPACTLIERESLSLVPEVLRTLDHRPNADDEFIHRWCAAVRHNTGRPIMQAPMTVERRCEFGLKGLLNLKMRLKDRLRDQQAEANAV